MICHSLWYIITNYFSEPRHDWLGLVCHWIRFWIRDAFQFETFASLSFVKVSARRSNHHSVDHGPSSSFYLQFWHFCLVVCQESIRSKHPQLLYESKLYKILQGGSKGTLSFSFQLIQCMFKSHQRAYVFATWLLVRLCGFWASRRMSSTACNFRSSMISFFALSFCCDQSIF